MRNGVIELSSMPSRICMSRAWAGAGTWQLSSSHCLRQLAIGVRPTCKIAEVCGGHYWQEESWQITGFCTICTSIAPKKGDRGTGMVLWMLANSPVHPGSAPDGRPLPKVLRALLRQIFGTA